MAWSEPKTNWSESDFATVVDMNRIFQNAEWLDSHEDYEHIFVENDIVQLAEWSAMKDKVIAIAELEQLIYNTPDNRASADNFNNVEDILKRAKRQNDARWNMYKYNHYAGQGFSASNYQIYCGGHVKDIHDEKYNMYKYNHYAGSYRVNSGIYVGGYLR